MNTKTEACYITRFSSRACELGTKSCVVVHDIQSRPFQTRISPWMMETFGAKIAADKIERNHRFIEEALELVQALGCSKEEVLMLVDYVYGRPLGEPGQEVGGVMVTLAALCLAQGLNMHEEGEQELARVWTLVDKIRAKQASKPRESPLPATLEPDIRDVLIAQLSEGIEAGFKLVNDMGLEGDDADAVESAYHNWMLSDYGPPDDPTEEHF